MATVGLINYGSGNFASVNNALKHLDIDFCEIKSPAQMQDVHSLILPGVGAFPHAMLQLHQLELVGALRENVLEKGKPFLGICIGMQILGTMGYEFEECAGLDFVPGEVKRMDADQFGLSVPHMGWNQLSLNDSCPLFEGLPDSPSFYFVHSFRFKPTSPDVVVADCQYGSTIVAAVQKNNVFGVQFHPEKSQRDGLKLLKNFCQRC